MSLIERLKPLAGIISTITPYTDVMYLLDYGSVLDMSILDVGKQVLSSTVGSVVSNVVYDMAEKYGIDLPYADALIEEVVTNLMQNALHAEDAWVYKFRINPVKASHQRRKLQTLTEYGWGFYDLEMWGDSFMQINLDGTTGYMMPPEPLPGIGVRDIRLSVPYVKLMHLEKFFKGTSQRLFMIIYGKVYLGHLEDMSYTYDANDPRQIKYSFTFSAHPYFVFDIFSGDLSGVSEYNNIIWDNLARPTQAQALSNYGPILNYNQCATAPYSILSWRPGE